MANSSMTKEARIYNGEKTVSSLSGAGKIAQLHVKELKENILISFFCMQLSSFSVPFIEDTVFSPLYILASFVVD